MKESKTVLSYKESPNFQQQGGLKMGPKHIDKILNYIGSRLGYYGTPNFSFTLKEDGTYMAVVPNFGRGIFDLAMSEVRVKIRIVKIDNSPTQYIIRISLEYTHFDLGMNGCFLNFHLLYDITDGRLIEKKS